MVEPYFDVAINRQTWGWMEGVGVTFDFCKNLTIFVAIDKGGLQNKAKKWRFCSNIDSKSLN